MLLVLAASGCASNDIGQPCPDLLTDAGTGGASYTETAEVVAQDVSFPCDEFICIASEGTDGYCSKKCRTDAGCPSGFTCRIIQSVGPFATQKFCAWKRCTNRSDCGSNKSSFCCYPPIDANEELKLCAFSDDPVCP